MLNGVDSETLKKSETKWEPRVIAVDIETTNKKGVPDPSVDEILMISMWSNYGTHKVMLVKQCDEKNQRATAGKGSRRWSECHTRPRRRRLF